MTISSETSRNDYLGDGSANTYDFTYRILSEDDLLVSVKGPDDLLPTTLTKTTDYTVVIASDEDDGGTITLVDASQAWLDGDGDLKVDYEITIRRVRDILQETDIRNQGPYNPQVIEDTFDHLVMVDQQQQDELNRCLKLPETEDGNATTTTLPDAETRAGMVLGFDDDGNPTALTALDPDLVTVSAFAETLLDDASASAFLTTLGFTSYIQTLLNDSTAAVARETLAVTTVVSPGVIGSNQNNYAGLDVDGSVIVGRVSGGAAWNITGILAGSAGEFVILHNIGAFTLTLKDQDANSDAANRIITGTGADVGLEAGATLALAYDATTARWRVLGTVVTGTIKDLAVTTAKIDTGAVTSGKLGAGAVTCSGGTSKLDPSVFTEEDTKASPVGADTVLISDSEAGWAIKEATITSLIASTRADRAFFTFGSIHPNEVACSMRAWASGSGCPVVTTDQDAARIKIKKAGTLRNLFVYSSANLTNDPIIVYVRKGGVNSSITATLAVGADYASDETNTLAVAENDLIEIRYEAAGNTADSAKLVWAALQIDYSA
jgi:hypothetical protein